ncbi:MAG: tRNA (adenosine(37)-N6)-threonylcarbamoyltransferase complex dimerization subunit type 1 TsaB [Phycisphaerae bacterium]
MNLNVSNILAIETSSRTGSVAVGRGSDLLAQSELTAEVRHGAELIPAIDKLTRQLNLTPDQFKIICVSSGPGSFTGLRVGFTFARCLSQVTNAKLIAVPSTEVIVENLKDLLMDQSGPIYIAPILDAKRKQVYTAGFRWQGGRMEKILTESVLTPENLLKPLGRPLWITGEGLDYHNESFSVHNDIRLVDRAYWLGQARNVLKLGFELARQNQFIPYDNFTPTYIRLPEAEERWQLKQGKNITC